MNLIVTADLHLRFDQPLCRTDPDWMEAQRDVLKFIVDTANEHNADIIISGDVYNSAVVSARISTMFLQEMRKCNGNVFVLAGNHSLLNHREENSDESSIGALKYVGGNIHYLTAKEMKEDGRFEHSAVINEDVVSIHTLTFKDEVPFGANATTAPELLEKYKDFRYLVLGDNHTAFVYEDGDRYVINPGTPIIQSASAIDYRPRIYFVDTGELIDVSTMKDEAYRRSGGSITAIPVPNPKEYLTDNHLEDRREREDRIAAFIETVKKGGKVTLSFEDNLREALAGHGEDVVQVMDDLIKEAKSEPS